MTQALHSRLWTYQSERFPLKKTVPLLCVFSAASIMVSAQLGGRPLPGFGGFVTGFVLAMCLFFQMRVCDEWKDLEDDRRLRPDRPIPRGLISLQVVMALGVASMALAAGVALLWHPPLLWLLGLVWLWLALMTAEFGAPAFLKARPVLYLLSHMAIMPLMDLLLTGVEWQRSGQMAAGLWLFLALSFVNGCVLEIGRKLWAPEHEITGVDTYSTIWGPKRAAKIWLVCACISWGLLLAVGAATGSFWVNLILGSLGLALMIGAALRYGRNPDAKAEKSVDLLAGLWVFLCYAVAGFAPWLIGAIG